MVATRTPDYELGRRLIELFEDDSTLMGLVFPGWSPSISDEDHRIYMPRPTLDVPEFTGLPRIIVETILDDNDMEQFDPTLSAPVRVWIHSIVPKDQYDHCEAMDARIRTIIGSTYLTNTRIIASELVPFGPRRRVVEREFNDANRLSSPFRAQNVGVLV